jgi:hypothetical protein
MAGSTSCCGVLRDMEGFGAACLEGFKQSLKCRTRQASNAATAENGYSLVVI